MTGQGDVDYPLSKKQRQWQSQMELRLRKFLDQRMDAWIKELKCSSVGDMTSFEKRLQSYEKQLREMGYDEAERKVKSQRHRELENVAVIKQRQNLAQDCEKYLQDCNLQQHVPHTLLEQWQKRGKELLKLIEQHRDVLGRQGDEFYAKIKKSTEQIKSSIDENKQEMNEIWDAVCDLQNIEDIDDVILRIDGVSQMGIDEGDRVDFIKLKEELKVFLDAVDEIDELKLQRGAFLQRMEILSLKFSNTDSDLELVPILDAIGNQIIAEMDRKDVVWKVQYLKEFSDDVDRMTLLKWIDQTAALPDYLSDETIRIYNKAKSRTEKLLSKANVAVVIHHFKQLTETEKTTCLDSLRNLLAR